MSIAFNEAYYLQNNPDVVSAVALGFFKSGLDHFNKIGAQELRNPNALFDAKFYAIQYPDVLAAVSAGLFKNVFEHYSKFGLFENRIPNSSLIGFDGAEYIARYADVGAAGYTAVTALQHYSQFGIDEGRAFSGPNAAQTLGSYSGTNGDDRVAPAGGQAGAVRVEGGAQGAGGDTLVITSGSAASLQVINLALETGDQNTTRDNQNGPGQGSKIGPILQGFENVDARQATLNVNLTALARTSVGNTGGVAAAQTGSILQGGTGRDTLTGNNGADSLAGFDGNDQIAGGNGADTLEGGTGDDLLSGGAGDDVLTDGAGNDTLDGGAGNDSVFLNGGFDNVFGADGADTISITAGAVLGSASVAATATTAAIAAVTATLSGGAGDDLIDLRNNSVNGAALVSGGAGNDTILAGPGQETVSGSAGHDSICITAATLATTDMLNGNDGQDFLQLGITVADATKIFVFDPSGNTSQTAQIKGFEGLDLLDQSGTLAPKTFKIILNDSFLAQNFVNGNFLLDARGLPIGSNIVIDFSSLSAASAGRFSFQAFRILVDPHTGVRDQNNVPITSVYALNSSNPVLTSLQGITVNSSPRPVVAGTRTAEGLVDTGGLAAYTITGGERETGGSAQNRFTLTALNATLTSQAGGFGYTSSTGSTALGSDNDAIDASTLLSNATIILDSSAADNDTLTAILTSLGLAPTLSGIEQLALTSYGGGLSFQNVTGAQTISVSGTGFTGTNLTSGQTLTLSGTSGLHTLDLASEAGAADSLTLNLDGTLDGTRLDIGAGGLETITLNTLTASTVQLANGTNGGTAANILLTGSAALALTNSDTTAANKFDASAMTGSFSFTNAGASNVSVLGSAGNDAFYVPSGSLTANTIFDGGNGIDTLVLTGNLSQSSVTTNNLRNFEIVRVENTTTDVTINFGDNLVATGTVLTITTSQTSGKLSVNGFNETNGRFSITGGQGDDSFVGGAQNDTISGGAGNDLINAAGGSDLLTGGTGADQFIITLPSQGTDTITDFIVGEDKFVFSENIIDLPNTTATLLAVGGVTPDVTDYIETRNNIAQITATDNHRIVELQSAQTQADINTMTAASARSIVFLFNSTTGRGEVWFDPTWADTADRSLLMVFNNIVDLAGITGLTRTDIIHII